MSAWASSNSKTFVGLRRAGLSGRKLRSRAERNLALACLGSPPTRLRFKPNDHQTDALVTAAGMRALAADPRAFAPPGLTPEIARTEGSRAWCAELKFTKVTDTAPRRPGKGAWPSLGGGGLATTKGHSG